MRWVLPPKNDGETYYTYFLIQFEDCEIPEYDYTIVDALSEVADQLQIAETAFDDGTLKAQAVVSGIVLTDAEWVRWKDTFELPERFHTSSESPLQVDNTSDLPEGKMSAAVKRIKEKLEERIKTLEQKEAAEPGEMTHVRVLLGAGAFYLKQVLDWITEELAAAPVQDPHKTEHPRCVAHDLIYSGSKCPLCEADEMLAEGDKTEGEGDKDFWCWFATHFRSASEHHDYAATGEKASYWEGYMDAMIAVGDMAPENITQPSHSPLIPDKGSETEPGGIDPGEIPKMSDELAALSDMSAIEYSRLCDRFGKDSYDSSDIVDAHEAGQSWMYRKLQPDLSSANSKINQLEDQLTAAKTCWEAETDCRQELQAKVENLEDWIRSH